MTLMCTMEKMTRETPVCTEGESPTLGALEVPTSSCWSRAVASQEPCLPDRTQA